MASEPLWVRAARRYIGVAEIPGKDTAPVISRWLKRLGAWWDEDATPWCGTFVAACLDDVGLPRPQNWYRARVWLDYGTRIPAPVYGCIVVYERKGGGHVGFAVGRDEHGNILTLGGNQGDMVSIRPFDPARVLGYVWPPGGPYSHQPLPRFVGNLPVSRNEA